MFFIQFLFLSDSLSWTAVVVFVPEHVNKDDSSKISSHVVWSARWELEVVFISAGNAFVNNAEMLLIEIATALSVYVEDHVSSTIAHIAVHSSIHAVAIDLAFWELAENISLFSGFTSVASKCHFAGELLTAGEHDWANNSFALSNNYVGSVSSATKPFAGLMWAKSIRFFSSVLKPVKLDAECGGSSLGRHDHSAHFVTIFLNSSDGLTSFFDVVSVIFGEDEARGSISTISELDLLFEAELSRHYWHCAFLFFWRR